ncbi:MAG: transcription antiterminator [Erysipelotrichaceae bacterium]|nr:transcription antiterminator [Erysipelotrichaceae bacterium]
MNRKEEIVKFILNEKSLVSVDVIAKAINTSPKTVRNELDLIEPILVDHHLTIIRKPGQGISIIGEASDKQALISYFKTRHDYSYLSPAERQRSILAKLFAENRPLMIKELGLDYYVSRSTITKDISEINEMIKDFRLVVEYQKGEGIVILGEESAKRKALAKLVPFEENKNLVYYMNDENERSSHSFMNRFQESLQLDYKKVEEIVAEAETKLGYSFSTEARINLIIHIAIAIRRTQQGNNIRLTEELISALDHQKEYDIAFETAARINEVFKVVLSETETYYILLHFMGAKRIKEGLNVLNFKLSSDTPVLEDLILKFIQNVQLELNLFLESDTQLFNSLILHLKPTINRLLYGLSLENPMFEEIKFSYPSIYTSIANNVYLFKNMFHIEMPANEIAYLALHFAAARERNIKPIRVLVMCASGLGTSQLIVAKLKRAFNNLEIVDVTSTMDVSKYDETMIDLIISTVAVQSKVKTIVINALLPQYDMNTIREVVEGKKIQSSTKASLSKEDIHLQVDLKSKEEILNYLNDNLLSKKLVTEDYLKSLWDREAMGPTVISSMIAIPHGAYEAVLKSCIQIVTLVHPVKWDGDNEVKMILNVVSTKEDASDYIPFFTHLADHCDDTALWNRICGMKNKEDLAQTLGEVLLISS